MKYFSMFTGIGGFELGIKQAYERLQNTGTDKLQTQSRGWNKDKGEADNGHSTITPSQRGRNTEVICVGFSEIDKYANQLLQIKFPTVKNYGDATKINETELPDFDLLVGGFPCQSFSIAGKRRGFDDTRGTLFFDIARILAHKKPRNVLLENVKGLLSHDGGRTFQTIIGVLTDLGYFVEWQVLNSKNFGVPQNRERVFIIGYLGGQPKRKVFPVGENAQVSTKRQGKISPTITQRYYKQGQSDPYIVSEKSDAREQDICKKRYKPDHTDSKWGEAYTPIIRRLTPLECERLQGFPDNWTAGFSDTQRYKMCGNAVTVNVVQYVISKLYEEKCTQLKTP